MNLSKKAESLVWIVIAVSILSFVMLWILHTLSYSNDISDIYKEKSDLIFVEENAKNIAKKLDLSLIWDDEEFYIYKNENEKKYLATKDENYKFIDGLWNYVDPNTFNWDIYTRILEKSKSSWTLEDWSSVIEQEEIKTKIAKYEKN
jgi:hypothetical protein